MQPSKSEAKAFIDKLYKTNKAYYQDRRAKGLLRVLDRIHSSHAYVAEILQNAIDANATRVSFKLSASKKLIIEHNGKAFSKEDVRSISEAGTSKKLASDIGFMGIGFKSVYERFQKVAISSPPWKFYYDCPRNEIGQIDQVNKTLPIWNESISKPSIDMTCRFELSDPHIDSDMSISERIKQDLDSVMGTNKDLLVMLACQGIQEITWNEEDWLLEKEKINLAYKNIQFNKIIAINGNNNLEWIHLSSEYELNEKAKRAFYNHRQNDNIELPENEFRKVEAFVRLHNDGLPIMTGRGKSFAVLPMGVRFPFSLNIQADWLVDATRQDTLENNEWHKLIIAQLPELMAGFIKWATTFINPEEISDIYKALPDFEDDSSKISDWFNDSNFKTLLRQELFRLKFLPVIIEDGHKYISPKEAKFLQGAFSRLKNDIYKPWILLSDKAIFKDFTSNRVKSVLEKLDIKNNMSLDFLIDYWRRNPISSWHKKLEKDKLKALFKLYDVLDILYTNSDNEKSLKQKVNCIPTTNNSWINLEKASKLPNDWFTFINKDSALAEDLKSEILGDYNLIKEEIWSFNLYNWDNDLSNLFNFTESLKLDEILTLWWNSIPEKPADTKINLILDLSWKALSNNRTALIKKVLANNKYNELILVEPNKTLLSKPYLDDYREKIFTDLPVITNKYILDDPKNRSSNEWFAFFNNLRPSPVGIFKFDFEINKLDYKNAKRRFEELGYNKNDLKEHRTSPLNKELDIFDTDISVQIKNDEYVFINSKLPENWPDDDIIDYNRAKMFVKWISDSAEQLIKFKNYEIRYIPYGQSHIIKKVLDKVKPAWINKLQNQRWIPTKEFNDVLSPKEILDKRDPSRPNAPVADIPVELAENLIKSGIEFGTEIPKAPVLDRLKSRAAKLTIDELYFNLEEAIKLAEEDKEIEEELNEIIKNELLIPGPNNQKLEYNRFINAINYPLDNYLISYPQLSGDNKYYKVLSLINDYLPFPAQITFEQAISYIKYIWNDEPDPLEIEDEMRFVYTFINSKTSENTKYNEVWESELENAKVYIQDNKWIPLNAENNIYYDDFQLDIFEDELSLLKDSILGFDEESKIATAKAHNIKTLTEDFTLYITKNNKTLAPREWLKNLSKIKNLIEEIFNKEILLPDIKTCEKIKVKVIKENEIWYENNDYKVVYDDEMLYVVGKNVNNFARKLTTELIDIWGLNDVHFASDFGYLISELDKEKDLIRQINEIREEKGLQLVEFRDELESKKEGKTSEISKRDKRKEAYEDFTEPKEDPKAEGKREIKKSTEQDQSKTEQDQFINDKDTSSTERTASDRSSAGRRSASPSRRNKDQNNRENRSSSTNGSFTSDRRTSQLNSLLRQLESKLDMKIISKEFEDYIKSQDNNNAIQSDEEYRKVVIEYEKNRGRYPVEKPASQPGYDIISYSDREKTSVSRYIEIKGRSSSWEGNETVSLSKRQFLDALRHYENDKPGDYWLYVVEKVEEQYNIIPLLNPAAKVSLFDLRADHWNWMPKLK